MAVPDHLPGGMPVSEFLSTYWQKRPLLIRGAYPGFEPPLSPEELAGLSLEDEADSRLILERGGERPWQLRYGPFTEEDFASLPESHWTLLVQEVDRWVPEVAALLDDFLFVPGWRLDDVMVSYAPDGGNVGAHVDNYDVFLLQAQGRREWRIGGEPVEEEHLVEGIDVSILADFQPTETMILEAGDMLYLPPRIAHHGIAVGDCMTFSVGFRAPSHEDIITSILTGALEETDPVARYSDPELTAPEHSGRIGADAMARVREILREQLTDDHLVRWFGMLVTESPRGELPIPGGEEWAAQDIARAVRDGAEIVRLAPNRIAFADHPDGSATLFAHGSAFHLDPELAFAAPLLAGRERLDAGTLSQALRDADFRSLLSDLINDGHLEVTT